MPGLVESVQGARDLKGKKGEIELGSKKHPFSHINSVVTGEARSLP
jgi:hypothetical protein